jgi:hypothetical protein
MFAHRIEKKTGFDPNECSAMKLQKLLLIVGAVLLVLVIGIVLVLSGDEEVGPEIADGGPAAPHSEDLSGGDRGFLSPGELERLLNEEGGPTAKARYAAYVRYAQYPDHSRPLSNEMRDLTDPWYVNNVPLPVIIRPMLRSEKLLRQAITRLTNLGKSEEEIQRELMAGASDAPRFRFDLNRHTITAGDSMRAVLEITAPDGSPVDIDITESLLRGDTIFGNPALGSVPFERDERGRTVFTWQAPSADKKYWGNMTLTVKARVPGVNDEVVLRQDFYSSPISPARFTGRVRERLEDGHLILDVQVQVDRDCRYALQGNLWNADTDEPTHWVSADPTLAPGTHWVPFTFFGKIFRDGGHEGVFELRQLRGTCENMPFPASWLGNPARLKDIEKAEAVPEPPLLYIPYTNQTYKTRAYSLEEFSSAEWQSEHKDRRLERLRRDLGTQEL